MTAGFACTGTEAVAALTHGDRGSRRSRGLARVLHIPAPQPYRAPGARAQAGRVR